MKVGIFTDAHFCVAKSGTKLTGKYSERLDSLVKSYKYMSEVFKNNNVDLIINAGDTLDSDNLSNKVSSALYESLYYLNSVGCLVINLVGNHDKSFKDDISENVLDILEINNNQVIVKSPTVMGEILLIPFTKNYENLVDELAKLKGKYKYVISHLDYIEGYLGPNNESAGGFPQKELFQYNPKIVLNGHYHAINSNSSFIKNIGSLNGLSYSDSYDYGLPGFIIYNTFTEKLERYANPYALLFHTVKSSGISDLIKLDKSDRNHYRIYCNDELKEDIDNYLEQVDLKSNCKVLIERQDTTEIINESVVEINKSPVNYLLDYTNELSDSSLPKEFTKSELIDFIKEEMVGEL